MNSVTYTDYSAIVPAITPIPYPTEGELVFEEKIKDLLMKYTVDSVSFDEFLKLVKTSKLHAEFLYNELLKLIKSIPDGRLHDLSLVKNILTMDGRLLVHNEKNKLNPISIVDQVINLNDPLNFENYFTKIQNDPSKNSVTCSKLLQNCENDEMIPIFSINPINCKRKNNINYNHIGKLLLEVRISTPLSNFKGFITTGILDDSYGVGFFSEYSKSLDSDKFMIFCKREYFINGYDNIYTFYIKRIKNTQVTPSKYTELLPFTINISPIIGDNLEIIQNIPLKTIIHTNDINIIGCGDLNHEGHGPVDCRVNPTTFEVIEYIKSKYYANNSESKCITTSPANKSQSRFLNLRIEPTLLGSSRDIEVGSDTLSPTFRNNHFDMYNLLQSIYKFQNLKYYNCFGNIIINDSIIPVIGFKLDSSLGRVSFTISPYYKISNVKLNDVDVLNVGKRTPTIVFDTNVNLALTKKNSGFIGDVKPCNNIPDSNPVIVGVDDKSNSYSDKSIGYKLSMVNITIEINDSNAMSTKHKWGERFRYSGDFNKYNHDFSKNDFDSYPFPGDFRGNNVVNTNIINSIPSLTPENLVICATDDKVEFTWAADETDHMIYSSSSVQNI